MPISNRTGPRRRRSLQSGFSLLELLVVLAILGGLIAAILGFFDFSNQVANVQSQVADMQQSLRVAQADMTRFARMAGRGGLPGGSPAQWLAVGVRNNVTTLAEREIAGAGTPKAVAGTDIVTLRGCYDTLIQANSLAATTFIRNENPPNSGIYPTGTLNLTNPSPVDLAQDLEPLRSAVGRALLIVSALDESIYTVAEITQVTPTPPTGPMTAVALALKLSSSKYLALAGGVFNRDLATAQWACLLQEYRYYVREEFVTAPNGTQQLAPKLTRAVMEAGTDTPFEGAVQNLSLDLADNVFDLQAAIAFDTDFPAAGGQPGAFEDDPDFLNANAAVPDDSVYEALNAADRDKDDWLFNSPNDKTGDPQWVTHSFPGNTSQVGMQYLRLTTLARTDQPDGKYMAPLLNNIEDHDYTVAPSNDFNSLANRHFRRRLLQTVIDLRNL